MMKFTDNLFRVIFCFLFLAVSLTSCKQTDSEIIPSSEYAPYINAYTGGAVSSSSSIRIELTKEQPEVELNSELKGKPFTFSPSLKGKAHWVSSNVIEFVPEEGALKPGASYKATFRLGDFMEVGDSKLKKFEFSFKVVERNFSVTMFPLEESDAESESVSVSGQIVFSDVMDRKLTEKMFTVKTNDNQTLSVWVSPTENSSQYEFAIHAIKKGNEDITLKIKIDGKVLGINNSFTETVTIPAKDSFKFLSMQRIVEPEKGIRLIFSEPVSVTQDLKGLIEIKELPQSAYVFQVSGNKVNVYFNTGQRSMLTLNIYGSLKNKKGKQLGVDHSEIFTEEIPQPQVQLLSSGTIIPDSKNLIIPFRTVSLRAVNLEVTRIFESNVLMFMQNNSLSSSYLRELNRVGRTVYRKTLRLNNISGSNLHAWENHSVDLSGLIQQEPGAIYQITLSCKKEHSAYPCGDDAGGNESSGQLIKLSDNDETYYMGEDIDWSEYEWSERDNPCHASYYMVSSNCKATCNVLATNLGVIVKRNSGNKLWIAVSDILNTNPVQGADVVLYDYQLQPIISAKTNAEGFAELEAQREPFVIVASQNNQKTYLKVTNGTENSTSRFDVGGKEIQMGLKGFVYGERGVWRPGDTLHVSFILEDKENKIPKKHPVSLEMYNPRGQFHSKTISTNGLNGFYSFRVPTKADDPTGLWNAYVKIGGTSFHKSFRIETVKPNRLKVNLKLPGEIINASRNDFQASLSAAWLTGATASNLKAKVEMVLSKVNTQFKNYDEYIFNNPATEFESGRTDLFDGTLNGEGYVSFKSDMPNSEAAPGMLRANITTRVYEKGGDASIQTLAVPFSPYSSYVGVRLNQPKGKYIETDQDHTIDVVTVNSEGKPVNRSNLEYKIYHVNWSWWWQGEDENFESYVNNTSITPVAEGKLETTDGGKTRFTFRVNYPDWGRYLVYVKDNGSKHASGGTILVDWPDWRGRSSKSNPDAISMLTFSLAKDSYETGETVTAIIPASADGRALVAVENGSTILSSEWIKVSSKSDTKYQFKVTPEMTPNVYLHITLLQPHAQTVNNLPIRMYGVVPVFVTNKASILEPVIKMPDVLLPEEEFTIVVSEKNKKPMTYTLAIVDDGLLDLTNFKTPDPWQEFYARERLGVRTWDMFNDVIGAYTGSFSSLFSTGGDEAGKSPDAKANRFKPVVRFIGPFTTDGKNDTHRIKLPMYVGSVRTMIVAGHNGAYGKAEKTTPVRTPLMLLSSLPRVISTGEDIVLPVNVFAMESSVKNVTVTVETSKNLRLTDSKKSLTFAQPGDETLYFNVKAGFKTGKETVKITASGGGRTVKESIEIDVRNPNPAITHRENKILEPGASAEMNYQVGGDPDDSWVKLEMSRIPSVDISRRFDFLYNYYHYCSEQLASRAFPMLFISQFKDIDSEESERIKKNVTEAIKHLYGRQLSNGGIVYWPGNSYADNWITSYTGAFLIMAQEKGYEVNSSVINKWKSFQRKESQNWKQEGSGYSVWESELAQAYRLYTLALAGAPELGAMNRMKEMKNLSVRAKWRLAAAYAVCGKTSAAEELAANAKTTVEPYSSNNSIYGSSERDEAMILETLVLLKRDGEALTQARRISANLSKESSFSTQSTAFALVAMGRLAEKLSGTLEADWTLNGKKQPSVKSAKAVSQTSIPTSPQSGTITVKNNGKGTLYVNLITRTQLVEDTLPEIADNLSISVKYVNMDGHQINLGSLQQGVDFMAVVTVSNISGNTDYKDIALTHIIPSGWEIYNERMINPDEGEGSVTDSKYTYQDIRDDRVLTYFDLERNRLKEFKVRLQASYAGTFVLPAIQCEAMYEPTTQAKTKAGQVTVVR